MKEALLSACECFFVIILNSLVELQYSSIWIGTDPVTGVIDMSMLATGMSESRRQEREAAIQTIKELLQASPTGVSHFGAQFWCSCIIQSLKYDILRQKVFEQLVSSMQHHDEGGGHHEGTADALDLHDVGKLIDNLVIILLLR